MQAFGAKTVMPAYVPKPSVKERRRHGKESAGMSIPWFSYFPASGRWLSANRLLRIWTAHNR
jgi:hypothetical protein